MPGHNIDYGQNFKHCAHEYGLYAHSDYALRHDPTTLHHNMLSARHMAPVHP